MEEIDRDQDLAYTDQWGRRNYEYVSLGCDTIPVLKGRTPVQCYADFMAAFRDNFKHLLGNTIMVIIVSGFCVCLRYQLTKVMKLIHLVYTGNSSRNGSSW